MRRLDGRVVIITGAAGEIGAAVARRCAAEGARTMLVDVSDAVASVVEQPSADVVVGDITDQATCAEAVDRALRRWGAVHGLVNAAGIVVMGDVTTLDDERWRQVQAVNLDAPRQWARACLPALERTRGAIVNIASITATHAMPARAAYAVSKAGLVALTQSIAVDFGGVGVRANAISPGSIETDMLRRYCADDPAMRLDLERRNPLGRLGQPAEVAACCALLLSDEAAFMNGANVIIDGGRTAWT